MNRQIQFRIWMPDRKEMSGIYNVYDKGLTHDLEEWHTEQPIALESTGWFDKNGKLIFEGDIVEFDNTCIGGMKGIAEIIWIDDFCLQQNPGWSMWNKGYYVRDSFLGCEVVGNIFQTPDLLK